MYRPLIGISASSIIDQFGKEYHRAYARNAKAIASAGGLPIYIPTGLDEATLRAIYERVDAVLIPGGPDVDPSAYGQEPHPLTLAIDRLRDELELTLARWSVQDDRPLFGICRGHQVINVALGGTLVQDIPSQIGTPLTHDQDDNLPRHNRLHEVTIDSGSRLAAILGATRLSVNSLHHQSVQQPAPGALITAHAPDGVIEALEIPDRRFALSVQWHPEDLYEGDEMQQALFRSFIDAARDYALRRQTAA